MEYRQLGTSGLRVSVLAFGTVTFGGMDEYGALGNTDVKGAQRQLDMCEEAGVNLIDTANSYSYGDAERTLGAALAATNSRDAFLIATKGGFSVGDGPNDAGASRYHLMRECEASLRRLHTDYVDLYQVHNWDGQTPLEETLDTLDLLVQQGKVRYAGVSNYAGWQLMKAASIARDRRTVSVASNQIYYSLESREAELELLPAAVDQGVGILVWSPLAGGLLTGKYRHNGNGHRASGRHSNPWPEPPLHHPDRLESVLDCLADIAAAHDVTPAQVALAWTLARPGITSLVIGARTDDQLAENLAAATLQLTAGERAQLDQVSAPIPTYPTWHQRMHASDRLSPTARPVLPAPLT